MVDRDDYKALRDELAAQREVMKEADSTIMALTDENARLWAKIRADC